MQFFVRLLASALVCAASVAAHAASFNFTLTGGDGTYTFTLPSDAAPVSSNSSESDFDLASATYNGQTIQANYLTFYSDLNSGGLFLGNSDGTYTLNEFGPQIFTGSSAQPVFQPGSYTLSDGSSELNGVARAADGDVLTISLVPSTSPVPEPSTLALFGTGVLSLAGLSRRFVRG